MQNTLRRAVSKFWFNGYQRMDFDWWHTSRENKFYFAKENIGFINVVGPSNKSHFTKFVWTEWQNKRCYRQHTAVSNKKHVFTKKKLDSVRPCTWDLICISGFMYRLTFLGPSLRQSMSSWDVWIRLPEEMWLLQRSSMWPCEWSVPLFTGIPGREGNFHTQ